MATMLRISDAGAIALHAAVYLAAHRAQPCSARAIAKALCVSQAHLMKVLQNLSRAGLIRAVRGPKGGFVMPRTKTRLPLRRVLEVIEGRIAPTACLLKRRICDGQHCIMGKLVQAMNRQTMAYLSRVPISRLVSVYRPENCRRRAPPIQGA